MGLLSDARRGLGVEVQLEVQSALQKLAGDIQRNPLLSSWRVDVTDQRPDAPVVQQLLSAIASDRRFDDVTARWQPLHAPCGDNESHIRVEPKS